jgi:hypothetical protein
MDHVMTHCMAIRVSDLYKTLSLTPPPSCDEILFDWVEFSDHVDALAKE